MRRFLAVAFALAAAPFAHAETEWNDAYARERAIRIAAAQPARYVRGLHGGLLPVPSLYQIVCAGVTNGAACAGASDTGGVTIGAPVTDGIVGYNLYVGTGSVVRQSPYQVVSDVAPAPMYLAGEHAFPAATGGNATGGALSLYGGIGKRLYTVVDYTALALDTLTVTVNGTATVRTEGTNWTAATSNAATATSIATAIDAIAGVGATASSDTVRVTADAGTYSLTIASGDGVNLTVTSGTDGAITVAGPNVVLKGLQTTIGDSISTFGTSPTILLGDGTNYTAYAYVAGRPTIVLQADNGVVTGLIGTDTVNHLSIFGQLSGVDYYANFGSGSGSHTFYSGSAGLKLGEIASVGQKLTNATMAPENTAQFRSTTHSYTWTNAQVVALGASLTGDITVATLPAKTQVLDAAIVITGQAAGVTTLTVSCGDAIGGTPFINYIVASDAKVAANTFYGDAVAERGTSIDTEFYYLPSYTATTLVTCHFISTVENLDQTTGSTGRVILTTRLLP